MIFLATKWEHRASPHILSWLEPVMGFGEGLRLPRGEALNQVLEDKLELPGRGEWHFKQEMCTYKGMEERGV